ncbi:hypothetical protein BDN70DRAFT_997724 [Pholiota conissans]|uniref:Uncharacterized protein n=1 Tax=Pholiota conissans TaxID=109636 RepID=A0A9P5YT67_9AGAR|nr:hypothetical protein BDN70DRAFT_997724 [Pholiota conissans]
MSSLQNSQNRNIQGRVPPTNCNIPLKDSGTRVDVDAWCAQMRADMGLRLTYMKDFNKTEAEFYEWFDNDFQHRLRLSNAVSGARPTPDNQSIRYTQIPSVDNYPSLTIRWWLDFDERAIKYNFDFLDRTTGEPISPTNLKIQRWEVDFWYTIKSVGESMMINPSIKFVGPPRWLALPGARLRLLRDSDDRVLGEVIVPQMPSREGTPQYFSTTTFSRTE